MLYHDLISVIIPTYKRSETIVRTIKSVINQSYKNIEIIVVDDNDPFSIEREKTEKNIKDIEDDRLIYIKHPFNKNGSAARNTGILNSKGNYLMFLDDDDEYLENKVLLQFKKMETLDESWGASYTGFIRKKNNKVIGYNFEKKEGNMLQETISRNFLIHAGSNLMIRREVLNYVQKFDESFQRNQDIEFLIRILEKYKIAFVDYIGLIVNRDDSSNRIVDFHKLTLKYKDDFKHLIDKMKLEDKLNVHLNLDLQVIRNDLFNFHFIRAFKAIYKNKIKYSIFLRYVLYLFHRKITKKVYGFKLSKTKR